MDMDTHMRRGTFIDRSLRRHSGGIQEAFSCAVPSKTLAAVKLFCCYLYSGMPARLARHPATHLMNCWGIEAKGGWRVP